MVQIHPPQPNLLNRNGLLTRLSGPFLHLGKIWERNHFSRVFLRPRGAKNLTEFFGGDTLILCKRTPVLCVAAFILAILVFATQGTAIKKEGP